MHPTVGGLVWERVRHAAIRVELLVALSALLVVGLTAPSCGWVRSNLPGQAPPPVGAPALLESEPEMRVRLASEQASVAIEGTGTAWVGRFGGVSPSTTVVLPTVVTRGSEGWWLLRQNGERELFPMLEGSRFPIELRRMGGQGMRLGLDDGTGWEVPGRIVLVPRDEVSEGVFDVIEHVGTETYLAGVLAAELPWDWSLEAKKAQAVAARSYALQERQRRLGAGSHFDVESDTRSQAYAGAETHDRARQAVRETGGLVLVERGALVRAYYSSTCGGRQQDAREIWPTRGEWAMNLAPAINAGAACSDCGASPLHRWTVTRTRAALRDALRSYGERHGFSVKNVGAIRAISVGERTGNGRPKRFTIADESGKSFTLTAEHFRQAANFGLSGERLRRERVPASDLEATIRGETVTLSGRGFGHGVGLCQYGAEGMARRGLGWQRILREYYPTAQVSPFYGRDSDRPGFAPAANFPAGTVR
ncbi:MAG: SpoIID/LytB domain-containing protein [Phycisphaerales bacterium]